MAMIAHDWVKPKSRDERKIMIRRARHARLIISCSYAIIISTLAVLIVACCLGYNVRHVTNVTDTGRPLPLQVHYAFDVSASPRYEVTFLVHCFVMLLIALSYTGLDNFLGLLVFHICGQLENLTGRLHRMREAANFNAALRTNIADHTRLIRCPCIYYHPRARN